MIKVKSRSITLLSSTDLKSLLEQISDPFPQPNEDRIAQLAGLIEQINIKAESLTLSFSEIAAEYFVRTCVSHKLVDGNKRSAVLLLGAYYQLNGKELPLTDEKIATYAVMMASIKTNQITVDDKVRFFEHELSVVK